MPQQPRPEPTLQQAVKRLIKEFRQDSDYARAWRDNIAMAFQDEFHRHTHLLGMVSDTDIFTISNYAANNFIGQLCSPTVDELKEVEALKAQFESDISAEEIEQFRKEWDAQMQSVKQVSHTPLEVDETPLKTSSDPFSELDDVELDDFKPDVVKLGE